jgi:hypothetical protein
MSTPGEVANNNDFNNMYAYSWSDGRHAHLGTGDVPHGAGSSDLAHLDFS